MRFVWGIFAAVVFNSASVADDGAIVRAAKSFLTPQKFPATFSDASFVERMDVLAQGYEPWESEYDSSGRCIRGCAYYGMTIEEELAYLQNQTDLAIKDMQDSGYLPKIPQQAVKAVSDNQQSKEPVVAKQKNTIKIAFPQTDDVKSDKRVENQTCVPRQQAIASGQLRPVGEPVVGRPPITSPYGRRVHPVTGVEHTHKAVDFGVPPGTNVFTTASGVVTNVWTDDTAGRAIKIQHEAGYETLYLHLDEQLVRVGDRVDAGCLIGKSGNTGRTTGPHLHYAIKYRGVYINPHSLIGR
ncbi:MAG: hypothetical protein E7011_05245 [Alphaproteobacteria bacterium]|nr:hypothetical protein [Alphaproteobacteria bacterium]